MNQPTKAGVFLWIPPELRKALRVHCAENSTTTTAVIRGLLEAFLSKQPAKQAEKGW